jgi:ABC-2 type transport system ATP-binding protein
MNIDNIRHNVYYFTLRIIIMQTPIMETAIRTNQLCKRYPGQKADHAAIQEIDLQIPEGTLYGLVGPDGAGKTTIIRILATVLTQTSGEAFILEQNVSTQAGKARRLLGYMPQNFTLYPDLNVIENLNFFADINGVDPSKRKKRLADLLSFTRLEKFQQRRSEFLSGGMRKKLALACAMIHEPRVLLLDEPTTGVDPVSRRELWLIIAQAIQLGVTVLVSTPYMDEAERCHTVGILDKGRFLVTGKPAELEAQMPFQVLEVKAKPRSAMRSAARKTKGILQWRPVGDRLRLFVQDSQKVLTALEANLKRERAEIEMIRQTRKSMEDVFIHLAEREAKK